MKRFTFLVVTLVLLGGIGYGVYRVGLNIASDKLMENVSKELVKSGEMAKIKQSIANDPKLKQSIENDPELKSLIGNAKPGSKHSNNPVSLTAEKTNHISKNSNPLNFQTRKLPFDTKEEAAKFLIARIGLSELKSMYSKVQAGTMTKAEVLQVLRSKLSNDEITALKLVAYKEMNKL